MDEALTEFLDAWRTFALAVAIALLIGWLSRRGLLALARRTAEHNGLWARVIRVVSVPSAVALPLLLLQLALRLAPQASGWVLFLRHLLAVGLILCLTWLAIRAIGSVEATIRRRYPVSARDNLRARAIQTQTRVLSRAAMILIGIVGLAGVLMTFPMVRQIGAGLLASAGLAGIVAGIAARPVLANLIAGLQIALTQPIRIDDVLIVQDEWGRVEEIGTSYVVLKIWDERRMIIPLQWFIENPFQNWTRRTADLIGSVFLWLDYTIPLAPLRAELERICKASELWDRRVCVLQVTDASERDMQVRALVSAGDSGSAWDLRCLVRERLIDFIRREHPEGLPRLRGERFGEDHAA